MKTYRSCFLDLGTSWRRMVSFTPRPFYPRYPLDRRPGASQSRFVHCKKKKTPWPESASELCWPNDSRLSAKLVLTLAERAPRVQSDGSLQPYSRISRPEPLLFSQVAPQLYSRGWVNPIPDPLLFRKSGSAGNLTQTSGSVARNSDH
jgi:hypothetical protein